MSGISTLSSEVSQKIAEWAKSTLDLPPSFTNTFLSTKHKDIPEESFSRNEYGRFMAATHRNKQKTGSQSLKSDFCDKLQSFGLSALESEELWNSGEHKVQCTSLAQQVVFKYASELGLDDRGVRNFSRIYDGDFTKASMAQCTEKIQIQRRETMREIDVLDGYAMYPKLSDPEELDEMKWKFECRLRKAKYCTDDLLKRVMDRIDDSVSEFRSTVESMRSGSLTTNPTAQLPDFEKLPPGTGYKSTSSNGSSEVVGEPGSTGRDQSETVQSTRCDDTATRPPSSGMTQVSGNPSTTAPHHPPTLDHSVTIGSTIPATTTHVLRNSTVPAVPASHSQRAASLPASTGSGSSTTSSVSSAGPSVFSDAGSSSTAASSVPGSIETSVPDTDTAGSAKSVSPTSPQPSPVPSSPPEQMQTTPPAPKELMNTSDTPGIPLLSTVADESDIQATDPDPTQKEVSRWQQSVQEELDRRIERPAGLTEALSGEVISDQDLSRFDSRESNLQQYRKQIMAMFPNIWHSENSQVGSYYQRLSDAINQLGAERYSASRRVLDAKRGKSFRDGSSAGTVSPGLEHDPDRAGRVYTWLTKADLPEAEPQQSVQSSTLPSESTEETRSPPSSEDIEAIWEQEAKEEAERRGKHLEETETDETTGISMDSSGIETNIRGGIPNAGFGQEGDLYWRDHVRGNWDYQKHRKLKDLGLPTENQPPATGDQSWAGLEGIR